MAETVKHDGRRERSRLTRARVIEAAAALFVEHGYLTTTIEDVAERARVAVQTVYYLFGTKQRVLSAVLDASIAGDVDPVAVLERDWVTAVRAETDATAAVERLVDAAVAIVARTTPIYEVIRGASADPEVRALLDKTRNSRRADQRALLEILEASGHLRPDVDVVTAADVFYGLLNEEVFQLFTADCGWNADKFCTWAQTLLVQQLVASTDESAESTYLPSGSP